VTTTTDNLYNPNLQLNSTQYSVHSNEHPTRNSHMS